MFIWLVQFVRFRGLIELVIFLMTYWVCEIYRTSWVGGVYVTRWVRDVWKIWELLMFRWLVQFVRFRRLIEFVIFLMTYWVCEIYRTSWVGGVEVTRWVRDVEMMRWVCDVWMTHELVMLKWPVEFVIFEWLHWVGDMEMTRLVQDVWITLLNWWYGNDSLSYGHPSCSLRYLKDSLNWFEGVIELVVEFEIFERRTEIPRVRWHIEFVSLRLSYWVGVC